MPESTERLPCGCRVETEAVFHGSHGHEIDGVVAAYRMPSGTWWLRQRRRIQNGVFVTVERVGSYGVTCLHSREAAQNA
jgi:hypothetical protein